MTTDEKFAAWAVVELFGHQRVAGRISEQTIGGETFIRVDVPRGESSYTRLFGKGAIYAINLCDEATARGYAAHVPAPLQAFTALPAPTPASREDEDADREFGVAVDEGDDNLCF